MSLINVNNLTFGYDGNFENVFEDVSFHIDTDWKLGLIGRNGKGKTTFLKLLLGEYEYKGSISKNIELNYFPYKVKEKQRMAIKIVNEIAPNVEDWEIIKELNLLNTDAEILYRNFNLLSGGEQIKILLISLFLKDNNFLLIDEPTNHLDSDTRENKDRQDNFELAQNEKLQKDINRLEVASQNTANWSEKIEKSKYNTTNSGSSIDRGYIGHQSAKMMKKSKVMEKRIEKSIEKKSNLLHNIDRSDDLKIVPLEARRNPLIIADDLQIQYNNKAIFNKVSFEIKNGDRVAIIR